MPRKPSIPSKCITCGKNFLALKHSKCMFCSNSCAAKSQNKVTEKICEICQKEFIGVSRSRFCPKCATQQKKTAAKVWQDNHSSQLLRNEAIAARGYKCAICGLVETDCLAVLQFHHIDPSTKNRKAMQGTNHNIFMQEVAKCVLVCANCHVRLHRTDND